MFKNIKWTSLAVALLYIVSGVLLLLYPQLSESLICNVVGIALIVGGVIQIAVYLMMSVEDALFRNDFVEGVILILIGILVIYQQGVFQQLVPYVLSIVVIASGIMKLQDGIDAYRIGFPKGWIYLVLASVSIIFGLVIMFGLIPAGQLVYQVLGAGLTYSGITDLISSLFLSVRIKKFTKAKEEGEAAPEPEVTQPEEVPAYEPFPEPPVEPAMNFDPDTGEPLNKPQEPEE